MLVYIVSMTKIPKNDHRIQNKAIEISNLAVFSDGKIAREYVQKEILKLNPNSWYPSKSGNVFYASKDSLTYEYAIEVFPVKDF